MVSSVSQVVNPHKCEASLSSALPSLIKRYLGVDALPSIIIASKPAFSVQAQSYLLHWNKIYLHLKHFVVREILEEPGKEVPVKQPVEITTLLSSDKGSVFFGTSFKTTQSP